MANLADRLTDMTHRLADRTDQLTDRLAQLNSQPDEKWQALLDAATEAAANAYAPYSHYPVGAAAYTDDGRLLTGCNVENASIGLTLCAECGLVSAFILSGGGALTQFVSVNGSGEAITPCGRCRQLLLEHGGVELEVWTPRGPITLGDLMPFAWGPEQLVPTH